MIDPKPVVRCCFAVPVPVTRLGPVLSIILTDNPRCIVCGHLVSSGPERLAQILAGEVNGICHYCDNTYADYRRHYYESRYEKR